VTDNIPKPAATVLVLRDGADGPEVFMVRRHEGSGAFRGAHVFPGGRVDAEDTGDEAWCDGLAHARRQLADLSDGEAEAFHVAAVRELFEEAGVLLARHATGAFVSLGGANEHQRFMRYRHDVHGRHRHLRHIAEQEQFRLALDALTLYAHWVTPVVEGRRFDTRFFVTRLPPRQTPAHDETETTGSGWITAEAALVAGASREIVLPPPTWITLRELQRFASVDEIINWAAARKVRRREPEFVRENDTRTLVMREDRLRFVWTDGYWRPEGLEGV
jgi:8-oxo-dGTP pyrophosphatase MutT (NUDIX family)